MKTIMTLIRREWEENYKSIIGFFIIANALYITTISYSVFNDMKDTLETRQFFFSTDSIFTPLLIVFNLGIILSVYLSFSFLNNKLSTSQYLLIPASTKQKWVSKWVFYTFIFFIIEPFILALIYYSAVEIINNMEFVKQFSPNGRVLFHALNYEILIFTTIFLIIQSFFFVGMIHFKKYAFVKSFILFIIFAFFLIYFLREVGYQIINEDSFFFSRSSVALNFSTGNLYRMCYTTPPSIIACLILFWVSICILLLSASFYKLKEREL